MSLTLVSLSRLKVASKIRRVGPTKGGSWEVVSDKNTEEVP